MHLSYRLLDHIAPDQHTSNPLLFGPILGHASVCKDCDFSVWSYRLTADAQDNELIEHGVYCRGCGRGGRRGRPGNRKVSQMCELHSEKVDY